MLFAFSTARTFDLPVVNTNNQTENTGILLQFSKISGCKQLNCPGLRSIVYVVQQIYETYFIY